MSQGDNINGTGETSALLQWRGDHGDRESADLLGWHFETVSTRYGDAVCWHVSVLAGGDDDWRIITQPHGNVADAKAEACAWVALAIGAAGPGEPIGWIEPQVFVELAQRKPWTAGANNEFCQRRSERYSVPIFAVAATHSVTIPVAAPADVGEAKSAALTADAVERWLESDSLTPADSACRAMDLLDSYGAQIVKALRCLTFSAAADLPDLPPHDFGPGCTCDDGHGNGVHGWSEQSLRAYGEQCRRVAPVGASRAALPMVVLAPILAEVERAMRRFPTWPTDPVHAAAVVNEECGELVKAVLEAVYEPHKSTVEDVRAEAIQAAATAIRFIASLDRYEYVRCPQHEQPTIASTHEVEASR